MTGQRLGRYEIGDEIGRGGMAAVYRARDTALGRDVAIKVMHGFLAGREENRERFRREAQAVAALKHDAVVEVYDFAPAEGAQPGYIVAELIRGPTLRQVLDERGGRILPEVAMLVGARVAAALQAAHAQRIVHRDVKPDNIMFDRRDGAARVVLADFGVAHVAGMETMTATGALVGSPAYMSPEQARGDEVGPASDVFSLGVVLYHMATGRLPFPGKDPLTTVTAILRGEFHRPSQVAPQVAVELERIILRCMQTDPEQRYADAGEIRRALLDLARGGGLDDENEVLRRFLEDPSGFAAEHCPRIAAAAYDKARAAARRGDFGRALAEIGRVFAYERNHAGAQALLESISRRRRWLKAAGALAALAALAGAGYAATSRFGGPPLEPRQATSRSRPATPLGLPLAAFPSVASSGPVAGAGSKPLAAVGDAVASSERERPHPSGGRRARAQIEAAPTAQPRPAPEGSTTAGPPAGEAPPGVAAGTTIPPLGPAAATLAPAPTAPAEAAPAGKEPGAPAVALRPRTVTIRVQYALCTPSLDDLPPQTTPAVYPDVTPGKHDIYCTMPDRTKVLVKPFVLGGGPSPALLIRVENGKPRATW